MLLKYLTRMITSNIATSHDGLHSPAQNRGEDCTLIRDRKYPFRSTSGSPEFSASTSTTFRRLLTDNRIVLIQLHAHLSGSISRQCLHEVWLMKKEAGETDLADPLVEMPDGKHDYNLKT